MDWIQFSIFVITFGGLFFWNRSEANSDRRDLVSALNSDRKEMIALLKGIQDEMKDFHGRLCTIEERNRSR